jgi:hypothetical protein
MPRDHQPHDPSLRAPLLRLTTISATRQPTGALRIRAGLLLSRRLTGATVVLADNEVERVLVVVAHPDDADFLAGGTVARWTGAGITVTYGVLSDGTPAASTPRFPGRPAQACAEPSRRCRGWSSPTAWGGPCTPRTFCSGALIRCGAGRAPTHPLPRPAPHRRDVAAGPRHPSQDRQRAAGPQPDRHYPGSILPRHGYHAAGGDARLRGAVRQSVGSQEGPPKTRTPAQGP